MTLPQLAKLAVETYVKTGKIISPPENLPEEFLKEQAGVFVTIEQKGQLRGCIGTYLSVRENIAQEIIHNAISAAAEDYRFEKIDKQELDSLNYIVYILSHPKPIKDVKSLNPKQFGIIVKTHSIPIKCGLLLPDLQGVDTVEQQIEICCKKADINKEKDKLVFFYFTVKKYAE